MQQLSEYMAAEKMAGDQEMSLATGTTAGDQADTAKLRLATGTTAGDRAVEWPDSLV